MYFSNWRHSPLALFLTFFFVLCSASSVFSASMVQEGVVRSRALSEFVAPKSVESRSFFSLNKTFVNPVLSWSRRHPLVLLSACGLGVGLCAAYRYGLFGMLKNFFSLDKKISLKVVLNPTKTGCTISVSSKNFTQDFTGKAAKFLTLVSKDASVVQSEKEKVKLLESCGYTKEKDAMTIKNLLLIAGVLGAPQGLTADTFQEFARACDIVAKGEQPELKIEEKIEKKELSVIKHVECLRSLYKNEDRFAVLEKNGYFLSGVFDGHGGSQIAEALRKEFLERLYDAISKLPDLNNEKTVQETIVRVFEEEDTYFLKNVSKYEDTTKSEGEVAGSTATVVVIPPKGEKIFVAYIGDSQAMVGYKRRGTFTLGAHRPVNEQERIKKAADESDEKIEDVLSIKEGRVSGLEVSRAFGDFTFNLMTNTWKKVTGIIATPRVETFSRSDVDSILIGSDGLWDGLPFEIGRDTTFTHSQYFNIFGDLAENKTTVEAVAENLCKTAEQGWEKAQKSVVPKESGFSSKTKDDVTVVLVKLPQSK